MNLKKKKTKLLVSFRTIEEIPKNISMYLDIADLKDPLKGSVGAWDKTKIIEAVKMYRKKIKLSATIGDIICNKKIIRKLTEFDNLELDFIKFGFISDNILKLKKLISSIGHANYRTNLVFVMFVDIKNITEFVEGNLEMFKQNNIKFLIMDTYKKNDENLTSFLDANKIQTFIKECKKKKIDVGLAGRLEQKHIKILRKFDPFVMGFRSAICDSFDRKILCKKKLSALSNYFFSDKSKAIESAGACKDANLYEPLFKKL